jgi:CelD/BcsL family acetyltransferase involved in cellulose biosynthesis
MIAMQPELSVRVLTHLAELREVAGEWQDLVHRSPNATPFQTPDWVISWAECFSPENIRVVAVYSGMTLVALAPLLIYPRGKERVLAFMAGGVSDYLDILTDQRFEAEAVAAIRNAVLGIESWTTLDLTDVPLDSVLHRTFLGEFRIPHDRCSVLALPKTREQLLQLLSKRQRANLRNARSRLQRAGGGNIEIATQESLPEFLDDLFRLHTTRWSALGQSGVLADDNIRKFHQSAAPALFARGILRIYRMRVEQLTAATLYALRFRDTLFCYLQGFDPNFAHLSPGTHLIFSVMEDAIQLEFRRFDFLRGDEDYKRHWRPEPELTYRMQATHSAILAQGINHEAAA